MRTSPYGKAEPGHFVLEFNFSNTRALKAGQKAFREIDLAGSGDDCPAVFSDIDCGATRDGDRNQATTAR